MNTKPKSDSAYVGADTIYLGGQLFGCICNATKVDIFSTLEGTTVLSVYGEGFRQVCFSKNTGHFAIISESEIVMYACLHHENNFHPSWTLRKKIPIASSLASSFVTFAYPLLSFTKKEQVYIANVESEIMIPCHFGGRNLSQLLHPNESNIQSYDVITSKYCQNGQLSASSQFFAFTEVQSLPIDPNYDSSEDLNFRLQIVDVSVAHYLKDVTLSSLCTRPSNGLERDGKVPSFYRQASEESAASNASLNDVFHVVESNPSTDENVSLDGENCNHAKELVSLFDRTLSATIELGSFRAVEMSWRPIRSPSGPEMILALDSLGNLRVWSVSIVEPSVLSYANIPSSTPSDVTVTKAALRIHMILELHLSTVIDPFNISSYEYCSDDAIVSWVENGLCSNMESSFLVENLKEDESFAPNLDLSMKASLKSPAGFENPVPIPNVEKEFQYGTKDRQVSTQSHSNLSSLGNIRATTRRLISKSNQSIRMMLSSHSHSQLDKLDPTNDTTRSSISQNYRHNSSGNDVASSVWISVMFTIKSNTSERENDQKVDAHGKPTHGTRLICIQTNTAHQCEARVCGFGPTFHTGMPQSLFRGQSNVQSPLSINDENGSKLTESEYNPFANPWSNLMFVRAIGRFQSNGSGYPLSVEFFLIFGDEIFVTLTEETKLSQEGHITADEVSLDSNRSLNYCRRLVRTVFSIAEKRKLGFVLWPQKVEDKIYDENYFSLSGDKTSHPPLQCNGFYSVFPYILNSFLAVNGCDFSFLS
jgi:hypothetical protein